MTGVVYPQFDQSTQATKVPIEKYDLHVKKSLIRLQQVQTHSPISSLSRLKLQEYLDQQAADAVVIPQSNRLGLSRRRERKVEMNTPKALDIKPAIGQFATLKPKQTLTHQ
ncbi:MAG: hypothetical protein AB8B55_02305 [Mariniblastus sp.]